MPSVEEVILLKRSRAIDVTIVPARGDPVVVKTWSADAVGAAELAWRAAKLDRLLPPRTAVLRLEFNDEECRLQARRLSGQLQATIEGHPFFWAKPAKEDG